jgi:membrane protein implicated in regulation of membrane protease activity
MEMWHYWIIAGLILLIVEIFTPAFVLGSFGIGCFIAGIAAGLDLSVYWQIFIFSAGTLLIFFTIRPLFLRYLKPKGEAERTNTDALAGLKAIVIEDIDNDRSVGRVKIGGEDWRAVSADDSRIQKDLPVRVLRVDGSKVIVEKI